MHVLYMQGQAVTKKLIYEKLENNLLLEFQWPNTKLNVKSAKYWQGAHMKYCLIKKL